MDVHNNFKQEKTSYLKAILKFKVKFKKGWLVLLH